MAHERVLDWWATALDRQAQNRPSAERQELYARLGARMAAEIAKDAGSQPAAYWLAAAARGAGDFDRALNEATAGVGARPARAATAASRFARTSIASSCRAFFATAPRACRVRDHTQALAGMVGEWEAFKARWTRQP